MPVILATQEAEIRRITIQIHPRQVVHETLSQKNSSQKRAGGVTQGVDPKVKSQYQKKKNPKKSSL
jgi:predicted P-loop ATPase